jgi:hypothetical protein
MVKGGLTAALASSVAALAASAAKEKKPSRPVKSRRTPAAGGGHSGAREPDTDQENSKTVSKAQKKKAAGKEGGSGDAQTVLATDQTKVLVSGLGADTAAEDLEDAFRCTSARHAPVFPSCMPTSLWAIALAVLTLCARRHLRRTDFGVVVVSCGLQRCRACTAH